jgi:hypothetical protein
VYRLPDPNERYVIGLDCAEGLESSNDSVSCVLTASTGAQVAILAGKITPRVHAAYTVDISRWYNNAYIMVENNNHGHEVLSWFDENGHRPKLLKGHDKKAGWSTNTIGKMMLFNNVTERARENDMLVRDFRTLTQLSSIEKSTLKAPEGLMDDEAMGYVIALIAIKYLPDLDYTPVMQVKVKGR